MDECVSPHLEPTGVVDHGMGDRSCCGILDTSKNLVVSCSFRGFQGGILEICR
jgi:hypothetical protein